VFADDRTIFVILKDGTLFPVEIVSDGKSVSKLVMAAPLAQTTIPEVAHKLKSELIFVGSSVGPSVLFKSSKIEEEVGEEAELHAVAHVDEPMDLYEDEGTLQFPEHVLQALKPYIRHIRAVNKSSR
jgi:cleavage and polyadenylation specificity factor subunit 1